MFIQAFHFAMQLYFFHSKGKKHSFDAFSGINIFSKEFADKRLSLSVHPSTLSPFLPPSLPFPLPSSFSSSYSPSFSEGQWSLRKEIDQCHSQSYTLASNHPKHLALVKSHCILRKPHSPTSSHPQLTFLMKPFF